MRKYGILFRPFGGALHSLVVRLLWEQNVGGSNPLAPTTVSAQKRGKTKALPRFQVSRRRVNVGGTRRLRLEMGFGFPVGEFRTLRVPDGK